MSAVRTLTYRLLTAAALLMSCLAHAAGADEASPTLRFGAALSLSGNLSEEGQLVRRGYDLWRKQVNDHGGIPIGDTRYRVDIVYRDDQSDARNAVRLAEKLIADDQVDFLLGPYGSAATFEVAVVAERHRIPLVEAGGSSKKIFSSGFRYTFGLLGPAADYFTDLLEGAATLQPKPIRLAVVAADQSIHKEIAAGAKANAARLGLQVTGSHVIARDSDLPALVRRLKREDPQLILFSAYLEDAVPFVRAAKTDGLDPAMLGMAIAPSQPAFAAQLGRDADHIYGTAQWLPTLPYHGPVFGTPAEYAALYRAAYDSEPDYHAAAASAAGVAFQLALTKAGSRDRQKVRATLASLDAMTFYGRIHFDARGQDVSNPIAAFQLQKGNSVVLWPRRMATGEARYPAPPWRLRDPVLKVAVLHYGPVDDYGWTQAAYQGAERMADALPYVSLLQKERAFDIDSAKTLRQLARDGYGVIFAHSYDFGTAIAEVAPEFPQVKFMWAGGVGDKPPNAGLYFGRAYEVRYLTGMVAGAMTRSNRIGYTAAMPINEVLRGIDAFARGVAAVNPDARVQVKWVGDWYDPPRERDVTLSLIAQGCDVITQHSDSYAPALAAEEKGVHYISYGSDLRRFAPHAFLTGMAWNWTPVMTDVVKAVRAGTWDKQAGQDWWYGMAQDAVQLISFGEQVPESVRDKVRRKAQDIAQGRFAVFPHMTETQLRAIEQLEPNVVADDPRLARYDYPETRELVMFVEDAAKAIEQQGEAIFPVMRQAGGKWFQRDRYIFVWDLDGNRLVYPPDPANEQGNMADLQDIDGKPIGRMIIDAAKRPDGAGWVHYRWARPGNPNPVWKTTYVMRVQSPSGKTWLVGSGLYDMPMERAFVTAVVDQAVALLERKGKAAFATLRDKRSPYYFHDTYVFVDTADGVELVNPAFPDIEGQSLLDSRDARGKLLVRDYLEAAAKHGAAWVEYYWPRPGTTQPVCKLTYVRRVRVGDEDLVVGAGIYEPPGRE